MALLERKESVKEAGADVAKEGEENGVMGEGKEGKDPFE